MSQTGLTAEQFEMLFGDSPPLEPSIDDNGFLSLVPPTADLSGEANLSADEYLILFGDSDD